tara:strand:- start:1152 stop:1295 length:144 start_codon:yes stop_codon:yes gene_type:complete
MVFLPLRHPSILAYGTNEPGETMSREQLEELAAVVCIFIFMTAWMFA